MTKSKYYFLILPVLFSACASPHVKAWNHYEAGMLLAFQGYEAEEGKTDKVEKLFNKALEENPNMPGVNASLGTYRAKQGDVEGARSYWEKETALHAEAKQAMEIGLKNSNQFSKDLVAEKEAEAREAEQIDNVEETNAPNEGGNHEE